MINLLNRISWILCVVAWLTLSFMLFWQDEWNIIFWILFAIIIKRLLLPHDFIQERVIGYTNKIIGRASVWDLVKPWVPPISEQPEPAMSSEEHEPELSIPPQEIPDEDEEYDEGFQPISEKKQETVPSGPSAFERFFAENALAKIGWILLFLWVLFFLWLIFNAVWATWKLIIWFIAWFSFFGIWVVLDGKWYVQESRTMLWVWILVNYLVILSWRYLIWNWNPITGADSAIYNWNTSNILTEWMTFFFLILNTIFAITTSLVYKSKTLLLFSFVFAFLNPFLIWAKSDGTPYTLVWYSAIISLGALFLSRAFYGKWETNFAKYLSMAWFVWWNILFVLAPITTSFHWSFKLLFIGLISIAAIYLAYKNDEKQNIWTFFIWAYLAFALMLFGWSSAGVLKTSVAFISYLVFLWAILAYSVFFIAFASLATIWFMLFAPLILLFFMLISGSLFMVVPVILWTLLVYLVVFSLVFEAISLWLKYLFFILLWIFLLWANVAISFGDLIVLDSITHTSVILAWIIFLFSTYFFSGKEGMSYLFSIWNIWTAFLLLPVIETKWEFMLPSIVAIGIFSLANALSPFILENVRTKDLKNLAISLVVWILFVGWELYNYWEIARLFPWLPLGYSFMWLAAVYFVLGFVMMNIFPDSFAKSNAKRESWKNAIYSYLWISISLFSIAILIIFASRPAVVASIWFFESTVLFFFFKRIKDAKIYLAACILFLIWIIKYSSFIPTIESRDFIALIPLAFVWASLMLNLFFMKDEDGEMRIAHDILHFIWMLMVWIWVANIVPHAGQWFVFFSISMVLAVIWIFYNLFASSLLSYILTITLLLFYAFHVFSIDVIFHNLEFQKKEYLKYLQYATVLIPWIWLYSTSKILKNLEKVKKLLVNPYVVYLFIASTIFIYDLSDDNVFSITIFWAIWAYFYLSVWIKKDLQKWRTIWLYILTLVLAKILLYDIWFGINDTILRVIALMFVGWLMIYISTLYSKKYPWNLLREFDISNLSPDNNANSPAASAKNPEKSVVNESIKDVEIGDTTNVIFELSNWKRYMIRSKNLIKIARLVVLKFWKSEFAPGELEKYYIFIKDNYKSELSDVEYGKILSTMREFAEIWWTVKFS